VQYILAQKCVESTICRTQFFLLFERQPKDRCIISLEKMPQRFREHDKEPWLSRGLRIINVDNYCVLYKKI